MAHATLTSKGQVTIPKIVREKLNLKTGDKIDFRLDEGVVKLIPLSKTVSEVFGILERNSIKPVSIEQINKQLKKSFIEKKS